MVKIINKKKIKIIMIIIEVDNSKDGIEKALKKYKRKYDKTKVIKQLRSRKDFTKPSVKRRMEIKKAIYVEQKFNQDK